MSSPSPLQLVVDVLRRNYYHATHNHSILRKNEAATRASLIDPILRALGWDTADVRMVEPEKTIHNDLRVDYILHNATGKPQFVIEAKCLGESLDKHGYVSKVLAYALGFKVQTVFITDGMIWHCYYGLQFGKDNEPIQFQITPETLVTAALTLVQFLDVMHGGYSSLDKSIPAFDSLTEHPVSQTLPATQKVSDVPAEKIATNDSSAKENFISLTKTHLFPDGLKPTKMRFPDGSTRDLSTWKDVLVQACYFVLSAVPHLALPVPDKAGKTKFLLSTNKPEVGTSISVTHQNQTLFIATNYNAKDCVANALYILSFAPSSKQKVEAAIAFA